MTKKGSRPNSGSIWRSAGQLAVSVEDRFRFTLVVCFIGLGLLGTGSLFYLSNKQAEKFNLDAANVAVNRWMGNYPSRHGQWFVPYLADTSDENAPALLEPNRLIPKSMLPDYLTRSELTFSNQASGEPVWIISRHPLIENGISLVLSEKEYPELGIAREAFQFHRWLVATLLFVLFGACIALFLFNKHYIFRPLRMLREALLNRRLTDVARVKHSQKSKIIIERLEEKSRFPLEQFDGDEFGQIALILEDQDRRQKNLRLHWLKSFNTINEPVAIFGANGKLKHVNLAMVEFLDEIGITTDLVENLNAHAFVSSFLQLDEEIATKLNKVLNQAYPRVCSQACSIELPEGRRAFRYSISTISNHGERFAVFSLVREQLLGQNQSIEDVILEQTNNQLKVIHRIQHALKESVSGKEDGILHMCDALIDNIHSLLEISNSINPSLASHKVEFNLQQFFRDLQDSVDGVIKLHVEFEKSLPNFVVGDPTHLRQFLKGIFQLCQETSSVREIFIGASYQSSERFLNLSIRSHDGSAVLRDPAINLFLSHYSPFLSLKGESEDVLDSDEYLRVAISAPAGMNRIESFELDLSNRQLPSTLMVVSDEILPEDVRIILESADKTNCEWLTPGEILERNLSAPGICMLLFINNSQKLKEKQIQKVINHARANQIPSILLSQQPRRGESITALRLGFVTYLTLPVEQDELLKLFILTMNKSVRESVGKLGLLTKHTVRDIIPSLGKVLLGNISKVHQQTGSTLTHTLGSMGFNVSEATTVHGFFELLHKGNFEYVICSNEISTGLKRRIQVSLKGIPCLVFGDSNVESNKSEEGKNNLQSSFAHWVKIDEPNNKLNIQASFEAAVKNELNKSEFRLNTENEDNDQSESEIDTFDVAI
jgi:hypothetical protein